jgi:hypothetical protein
MRTMLALVVLACLCGPAAAQDTTAEPPAPPPAWVLERVNQQAARLAAVEADVRELKVVLARVDARLADKPAAPKAAPCPCGPKCDCAVCGCNLTAAPTYYRIGRHVYKDHPTAPGLLVLVSAAPAAPAAAGCAGGSCANGSCGVPQRPAGLFFRR